MRGPGAAQRRHTSDQPGPSLACPCGQPARYVDRRATRFQSVLGALVLERAYYYCAACQAGFCPRDRALGLSGGSLSPGVLRMVGLVGALVSFEEGHELLLELAGVRVPTKHVERAAEALGREIAHDERLVVEPPLAGEPVAPTLYLGLDGTGVPIRKEDLAGRAGKQPDGTANTREVKLVTIWSAEGRDADGTPVRDEGSISYSAAIESAAQTDTDTVPSPFATRVVREATRRGFDRAARRVVLGDGAKWIWHLADEPVPEAIQIVDRFHAKQHLSDVAKSIYGAGSDLAPSWAHARHDELDSGDLEAVLTALRVHSPHALDAPRAWRHRSPRACQRVESPLWARCVSIPGKDDTSARRTSRSNTRISAPLRIAQGSLASLCSSRTSAGVRLMRSALDEERRAHSGVP